jgi:integrase
MLKPSKPSPDFPLYPHASGKWAKKISGAIKYFGSWADPTKALAEYEAFVAATPGPAKPIGLTLNAAANAFLAAKEKAVARGELGRRTWTEYRDTCQRLTSILGHDRLVDSIGPQDFAAYRDWRAQAWNLIAVGNDVTRVRSLFRWLKESRLIKEVPAFGPDFKRPSAKSVRRHRRAQGKKLYTASEIRRILDECGLQMRAMVLLGINCGFGNTDCATLPMSALDLEKAEVSYPRPKTEVDRLCPLWPETVLALRKWLKRRPKIDIVSIFVLPGGLPWSNTGNPIAKRFRQILLWAGLKRGGFYWLRHTFETVGGGAKDQVAVNAIMGHVDGSMAAVYREEIEAERLRAVTDHVRKWLFGRRLPPERGRAT